MKNKNEFHKNINEIYRNMQEIHKNRTLVKKKPRQTPDNFCVITEELVHHSYSIPPQWLCLTFKVIVAHFNLLKQEFDDFRDADDAVYELNGKELLGERLVKNLNSFISHMCKCYLCIYVCVCVYIIYVPGSRNYAAQQ